MRVDFIYYFLLNILRKREEIKNNTFFKEIEGAAIFSFYRYLVII